ncbi:MAG TPA: MnmC family methyltransferase [Candidatus Gastranaerophilales bacterium]|nr:MnmC family methyltransferase [Candidatus Gastranaerophilales bacterium]
MNFYPIKTQDGTISLFNFEVNDVYHSKIGAYTEALHKYVIPSGILDFVNENKQVKILDICYGLGYNSKTAINEIIKVNPDFNIDITLLEIDPVVLAFSTVLGSECFDEVINSLFFHQINSQIDVKSIIQTYLKKSAQIMPQIREKIPKQYELIMLDELEAKLHNICYRSISDRNIKVKMRLNDARKAVLDLNAKFDFIFHDPFTPSKMPILWTVDFFKILYNLLEENGNLTTYSNAAPVRAGLIEAGFFIGQTSPIGKKTTGTIAFKKNESIKNHLSEKETGILNTKAGIPYRDKNLNSSSEKILLNREKEKEISKRISSGRFLKSLF